MTYSLFFFIRDVTDGNLVDWIDRSLAQASLGTAKNRAYRMRHALIEPLLNIYGVSDKVLNMTLADILLAARWTSLCGGRPARAWSRLIH